MADDHIRYDILTQDALRGVVRKVLSEVARTGLPGEHHFFITFATHAPGVRVSSRLLSRYPDDMTIVLQHQFWDLTVTEHAFEVGLSFNGIPERLLVPFTAIKSFVDPSVTFGVQFEIEAKAGQPPAEAPRVVALVEDEEIVADDGGEPGPIGEPDEIEPSAPDSAEALDNEGEDDEEPAEGQAQVVSLDSFRKKS